MANILQDDKYYSKYDKESYVWVEVDPNEPRDIMAKYMETNQGVGLDPTKNMTKNVYKLVHRAEYDAVHNPEEFAKWRKQEPRRWISIVMRNMALIKTTEEFEYFCDNSPRLYPAEVKNLKPELRNNKEILKKMLEQNKNLVRYADKEVQRELVLEDPKVLFYSADEHIEEFVEDIVLQNPTQIPKVVNHMVTRYMPSIIQNKPEILKDYPTLIQYVKDEKVLAQMSKNNPNIIKHMTDLQQIEVVEKNTDLIKFADKEIQKSIIVNTNKELLKDLDADMQKEIVGVLPKMLIYASESIQAEMVENDAKLFGNASTELQLQMLETNPMLIDYASYDVYYNHQDFVNELIAKEPRILQSGKVGYGVTEKHLKNAIEQNPFAIQYVEEYVGQSAHKYVKMAIESNPECLKVISKRAQKSVIRSFSDGEELLKYATNEVQATMISQDASYLAYASPEVQNNDEVVRQAVSQNPSMYQYASDRLKDDINVQKAMVESNFNALDMLSAEQRQNPIFAEQKQKWDVVERFRMNAVKLDDIDKQNFVDINFYNTIVYESKNKILRQFDSLTQGMQMSDKVEEKLQATVEKKLKQVESKLERQRNWALFKNGIKTKIDAIKADFNRGFQAGVVANEIKNMEL